MRNYVLTYLVQLLLKEKNKNGQKKRSCNNDMNYKGNKTLNEMKQIIYSLSMVTLYYGVKSSTL